MKARAILTCLIVLLVSPLAHAQETASSWGVVGSFVPKWHVPPYLEVVAALHFSEDDMPIEDQNLKGTEFRLGIARGRALSGDWGLSFVRRTFDESTVSGINGSSCSGGGSGVIVLQCQDLEAAITRRDVLLNGLEVHKFIPFVTIKQRVQVGLNVGGGFGFMSGQVDAAEFRTSYTCTFPPGVFPVYPSPDHEDPPPVCSTATISNVTTVQTGSSSDDVSRILSSDSNMLPLGKVEIAAAVIAGPRLKIRVAGGLNYPGVNAVSITGVYFFHEN